MVKDHSDSERGNPLPPHGLLFSIDSKAFLYAPSHRQDSTYHGLSLVYVLLQGRKDMFYLTRHSTHFIYGYMASNIW